MSRRESACFHLADKIVMAYTKGMKRYYIVCLYLLSISCLVAQNNSGGNTGQSSDNSGLGNGGSAVSGGPSATDPNTSKFPVWVAELPGGTYAVAVMRINSVSLSTYVVDGAVSVTEVSIETTGDVQGRFYYMEPSVTSTGTSLGNTVLDKTQQLLTEAATRTGNSDKLMTVMKNYPTTTHAKTVEYRLPSKDAVMKLFQSARDTWFQQGRTKFTLQ